MSRFGAVKRKVSDAEKATQIAIIGIRNQMNIPASRENVRSVSFDEECGEWYVTFENDQKKTIVVRIDSLMGTIMEIRSN